MPASLASCSPFAFYYLHWKRSNLSLLYILHTLEQRQRRRFLGHGERQEILATESPALRHSATKHKRTTNAQALSLPRPLAAIASPPQRERGGEGDDGLLPVCLRVVWSA
jgi:hypothetical protein